MKKTFITTFMVLTITILTVAFCACDGAEKSHEHCFDVENTDYSFIESEANCTSGAVFYYSCSCGERGEETFELNNKMHTNLSTSYTDSNTLYHSVKTICTGCSATVSEGLEFHNYDGNKCINCNHRKKSGEFEAGLYTSGTETLVYSWDELISEGILKVTGESTTVSVSCTNPELLAGDLIVPDAITIISSLAFMKCDGLSRISLPKTIINIGSYAFADCDILENVTLPNSVKKIGSHAFYNCDAFTSIKIPASVKEMGGYAFANCNNVTSVVLSNGLTAIEPGAFSGLSDLTSINIPKSITTVREYAFFNCYKLTSIDYAGTVEDWNEIEKNTYWGGYPNRYAIKCTDETITVD